MTACEQRIAASKAIEKSRDELTWIERLGLVLARADRAEAARRLGMSPNALRLAARRARKKLRTQGP